MCKRPNIYVHAPVDVDWDATFDPTADTGNERSFISQESMTCDIIKPTKALYSRSEMLKILGFFVGAVIVISTGSSTSLFSGNIDHSSIESLASEIEGLTLKLKETDTRKLFDDYQNAAIELSWARQEIADLKEGSAEHRSDNNEQVHKLSDLLEKEHEENLHIRGETDETISKLLAEIDEDDAELKKSSFRLLEMAKAKVSSEKKASHQTEELAQQLHTLQTQLVEGDTDIKKMTYRMLAMSKEKELSDSMLSVQREKFARQLQTQGHEYQSHPMDADELRAVKEEATSLEENEILREQNVELQQKLHDAMLAMSNVGDADHVKQAKKLRGDVGKILVVK